MALPEPILDDLRFQKDLVDEARRRIIRYAPDWTDYNISDPGITLIELMAWMTELITYRLNLVPDKNYVKFMDLLGVQLQPANAARTELTFRLSVPFPITPADQTGAQVPAQTEVSTRSTDDAPEVIFTTDQILRIEAPKLVQVRKGDDFNRNYLPRLGVEVFEPFKAAPEFGDTFYLGFDEAHNIGGYVLQLAFACDATQATGIRRDDPPLVWEVSMGNEGWEEVRTSRLPDERDTTGGLNNALGRLVLYLPLAMRPDQVHGRNCYWLRCRFEQRNPDQGGYKHSPRILHVDPFVLGGTVRATNAVFVDGELLGASDGEPGLALKLLNAPVLAPRDDETVEVEEFVQGEMVYVPWQRVDDFSNSARYDRHFTLDTATGEVQFGPSVRQPDGMIRQYGRVPPAGSRVRFTRYRYGGGVQGNVGIARITLLRSGIPFVDRVSNLRRAWGGRDQETIDEAKLRAKREVRAQQRAVTAEDYEYFARRASRSVARARCNPIGAASSAAPGGTVEVLVVPAVHDAVRNRDLSKLALDMALRDTLLRYIDRYRLLTTVLRVREPAYIGVKAQVDIVVSEFSKPDLVRQRVLDVLRAYLTPLPIHMQLAPVEDRAPDDDGELSDGPRPANPPSVEQFIRDAIPEGWEGWPFGRDLYVSELYALVQKVPGVKHVRDIKLGTRPINPGSEGVLPGTEQADQITVPVADRRVIEMGVDALICSLDHEVRIVTL